MGVSRRVVRVQIPAKDSSGKLARPVDFMMQRAVRSGRDTMFFEFSLFPQLTVTRPDAIHRALETDDRVLYIAVAETYPGIRWRRLRLAGVDNRRVVEAARLRRFWIDGAWQHTNERDVAVSMSRYVRGDVFNWLMANSRMIGLDAKAGDGPSINIAGMSHAFSLWRLAAVDDTVTQAIERLSWGV